MEIIEQHPNFTCKAGFIDMSTKETTLYKKAKTGKIQVYKSWAVGAHLYSEYGELHGKLQRTSIECVGKNIGRSNETTPEEQAVLEGISKCNLKRDKGYFDTIEEAQTETVFLPMLAKDGRKVKIKYPCDAQPKLDGVRCMAKDGNLMSRGGKPYDVAHITRELKLLHPGNALALDGELYIHGNPLQDTVSLVKKPKYGSEHVEYWIYDLYSTVAKDAPWSKRSKMLQRIEDHLHSGSVRVLPHIRILKSYRVNNEEEMLALHDDFVIKGFEGIILRTDDGIYDLGHRSSSLIKWKNFQDDEFTIVGYKEGIGKFVGCVIWECETVNGALFHVAPKGTLEQKKQWFNNANDIVGKQLTVRYFAFTNDGIPQFPVGIAIRDYEN